MHCGKILLLLIMLVCLRRSTTTGADNKPVDADAAQSNKTAEEANAKQAQEIARRAALAAEALKRSRKAWRATAKEYRRCRNSGKEEIRLAAVQLLRGIDLDKPAEYLATHVLKDSSQRVAQVAAEILGRFGSDQALDIVARQLARNQNGRPERIALLAESLANMRNPRVIEVLVGFLQGRKSSMKLIGLLGLTHFSRLDPALLEMIAPIVRREKDPYLRFMAVQVLARIPAVDIIPLLIQAVRSRGMAGAAALLVLKAMTHANAGQTARAWEKWYSEAIHNHKLPGMRPVGNLRNVLATTSPEHDSRQTDSYSSMLYGRLGLAEITGWDSSSAVGPRSRFSYSVKVPPVHRLELVDTGPVIRSGGKNKHGPMEIIPLYNGYKVHPATNWQWQELLHKTRQSGLDVVIVIDSTSSMGPVIQQVKSIFGNAANKLKTMIPDIRVGFVTYRDRPEIRFADEYVIRAEPLNARLGAPLTFLGSIRAEGGGDLPEAVDEGLYWATQKAGFKSGSRKVIIVVGDAPPHQEYIARALQLARQFNQGHQGIVSTVHCGGEEIPELTEIARNGGGQAYLLYQQQAVVQSILTLVFGQEYARFIKNSF